ncbi:Tethering factor for nuclear proteasome sts1 [Chytriomyces hyalinus]|nr:Tethering factor for nuclear proteasome sts1 [Chytriomyces hyalinus]
MSHLKVSWGGVAAAINNASATFGTSEAAEEESARAHSQAGQASISEPEPTTPSRKRKNQHGDNSMDTNTESTSNTPSRQRLQRHSRVTPAKRIRLIWDSESEAAPAQALLNQPLASTEERAMPLAKILETLDKKSLLTLIKSLVANNQPLAIHVASLLPRPSLESANHHLQTALAHLDSSYPYTSKGIDRSSDYAFGRCRKALVSFLDTVSLYLTHFTEPCSYPPNLTHEYPSDSFAFLQTASSLLSSIHRFSSPLRNHETLDEGWRTIARGYRIAIQECCRRVAQEGRVFPASLVGSWLRDVTLLSHAVDTVASQQGEENQNSNTSFSEGMGFGFREAVQEFVRGELGGIVHAHGSISFANGSHTIDASSNELGGISNLVVAGANRL